MVEIKSALFKVKLIKPGPADSTLSYLPDWIKIFFNSEASSLGFF